MSKIVQLEGFIFSPSYKFNPPDVFNLPTKRLISLVNSVTKQSKDMVAKNEIKIFLQMRDLI